MTYKAIDHVQNMKPDEYAHKGALPREREQSTNKEVCTLSSKWQDYLHKMWPSLGNNDGAQRLRFALSQNKNFVMVFKNNKPKKQYKKAFCSPAMWWSRPAEESLPYVC